MAPTVTCFVLADVYAWSTPTERIDRPDYHLARRGDRITVSQQEADRGLALAAEGNGGLSLDEADVEAATAASLEPPSWSDVELDSANVEDTVAYLTQHPSETGRVIAQEQSRGDRKLKVRKTVLEAAERIQAAHEEALADLADQREQAEQAEQAAYEQSRGTSTSAPAIPAPGS